MSDLIINDDLSIPETELAFEASRSSGPGGQHVNKTSTKITVVFDVGASKALSDDQKARIGEKLATRLSSESVLRVSSQRSRSQVANRDDALSKLATMIRRALIEKKPRRSTRPSRASKARRLDEKRKRAKIKETRSIVYDD